MDAADIAQEIIDARLEHALATRRDAAMAKPGSTELECEDCGEEIPAARREQLPGVATCVPCQAARENRR